MMTNKQQKYRFANIELLRIIAMLFIMFGHTHLRICTIPQLNDVAQFPFSSFFDIMLRCITTTAVGIFIAISGWFGVKFKKQGLAKYLFLVLFSLWLIYGIAIVFHLTFFNFNGIKVSLSFYEGYWFIMGYLGLYLLSPVLNMFIEHATKKEMQVVLISFFLFQGYYSWISGWYNYYGGYSIILFAGIYLATAYLKKYPIDWVEKNSWKLWLITILFMTIVAYFSLWLFGFAGRQIRDDNPLAILASILVVISFNKLSFQSTTVNWMATSCFTVYLIHYSPFVYPYIMRLIKIAYTRCDGFMYSLLLLLALLLIYLCCAVFDQIRIMGWRLLQKYLE